MLAYTGRLRATSGNGEAIARVTAWKNRRKALLPPICLNLDVKGAMSTIEALFEPPPGWP